MQPPDKVRACAHYIVIYGNVQAFVVFLTLFCFFYRAQHKTGPQVDDDTFTKVMHYIETGKKEGATLATGGNRIGNVGYFIEPTVFTNVTDNMAIATDEVIRVTPV